MDKTINMKPNYRITRANLDTIAAMVKDFAGVAINQMDRAAERLRCQAIKDQRLRQCHQGKIDILEIHNIVPLAIRENMATLISGTTVTPTFKVNYMAMGDDASTAANTDTTLGNETLRQTLTNRYAESNIAYLDKFWSTTDVGGNTYREIWLFCDGTGTADSGFLLSRLTFEQVVGANETLTINASITIA